MATNPDNIDAFLNSLGLEVEGPESADSEGQQPQRPAEYTVTAELRTENYLDKETIYFLHCYINQEVNPNELKGEIPTNQLFPGQLQKLTVPNTTLENVCSKLDENLTSFTLHSHRDPPMGLLSPQQVLATYELMNEMDDPKGVKTYQVGSVILGKIGREIQRGI